MKHTLRAALVGPLLLLLIGCTLPDIFKTVEEKGGDAADQAFALVATFNEIDAAALAFGQKSDTPREVKDLLKKLREPARLAIPLIAEAATTYRITKNQLSTMASPSTMEEVSAALTVLLNRLEIYKPSIQAFINYFRSVEV